MISLLKHCRVWAGSNEVQIAETAERPLVQVISLLSLSIEHYFLTLELSTLEPPLNSTLSTLNSISPLQGRWGGMGSPSVGPRPYPRLYDPFRVSTLSTLHFERRSDIFHLFRSAFFLSIRYIRVSFFYKGCEFTQWMAMWFGIGR